MTDKLEYYQKEIVDQCAFLCKLYRQHDTSNWPRDRKTIDLINGKPKVSIEKIVPKIISKPTSFTQRNAQEMEDSDNMMDTDDDDEDTESDENEIGVMNLIKMNAKKMEEKNKLIQQRKRVTDNDDNHNHNKKSMYIDSEVDEEKEEEEEEEEDEIIEDKHVDIDVNKIDFNMTPEQVAKNAMIVWLNLMELWTKATTEYSDNTWLANELYLDPLLICFIGNRMPLLQYLMILLKKLYASSNNNMPCERTFQFPKYCIGMYSHRLHLNTVTEFQNINEMQLNQEMNDKINNEFDETPYLIMKLMEIIKLQSRYKDCKGIQELWQGAERRTTSLQQQHEFWS